MDWRTVPRPRGKLPFLRKLSLSWFKFRQTPPRRLQWFTMSGIQKSILPSQSVASTSLFSLNAENRNVMRASSLQSGGNSKEPSSLDWGKADIVQNWNWKGGVLAAGENKWLQYTDDMKLQGHGDESLVYTAAHSWWFSAITFHS